MVRWVNGSSECKVGQVLRQLYLRTMLRRSFAMRSSFLLSSSNSSGHAAATFAAVAAVLDAPPAPPVLPPTTASTASKPRVPAMLAAIRNEAAALPGEEVLVSAASCSRRCLRDGSIVCRKELLLQVGLLLRLLACCCP